MSHHKEFKPHRVVTIINLPAFTQIDTPIGVRTNDIWLRWEDWFPARQKAATIANDLSR